MRTDLNEYVAPPEAPTLPALPAWESMSALAVETIETPPAVIEGLLRRGERAVLGGASKSFKSWAALDIALSVSHGIPWLGRQVQRGRVLVVNLELPRWCVRRRILDIAAARKIAKPNGDLWVWTLRGLRVKPEVLRQELANRKPDGLALVVIDPAYKLLQGRDENAADSVADLMSHFEGIAHDTGAAVLVPAHFAKGNASDKEAMDRISGSGVFARDPDSILTLTRHETEGAFTFEAILRTFPPASPVVVQWSHPVFRIAEDLDPARLKRVGRGKKYDDAAVLGILGNRPMGYALWFGAAEKRFDMPERTFNDYLKRFVRQGKVIKSGTSDAYYLPATAEAAD